MLHVYVDADACPVKEEIYRVAKRYDLPVTLVSNRTMRIPSGDDVNLVVVGDGQLDAADAWIVEHVGPGDIVITADIPLASRCLGKQARVLGPRGQDFTEDGIGDAVATRDLLSILREGGASTGGPPPFGNRDRSRFLHRLDEIIQTARRQSPPA
ncbi:MAG: YaiI/YqxD family protein [Candidatus Eiseniibacteriota bacterium]